MARLPEELITHILEYLDVEYGEDANALVNSALVSRSFNRIAEPLLYRRVHLASHEHGICHDWRFVRILKALLSRRDRCGYVRELILDPDNKSLPGEQHLGDELAFLQKKSTAVVVNLHLSILLELRIVSGFEQDLWEELYGERDEAYTVVFFCLCINLGYLSIWCGQMDDIAYTQLSAVLRELRRSRFPSPAAAPLKKLKTLHLLGLSSMDDFTDLIELPSLESVRGEHVDGCDRMETSMASQAKALELTFLPVGGERLALIFDNFSRLRNLTLEWEDVSRDIFEESPSDFYGNIGDTLRGRGTHLQKLCLKVVAPEEDFPVVGSLAGLTNLRELTMTHALLLGRDEIGEHRLADLLPPQLEKLTICGTLAPSTMQNLCGHVLELLTDKRFRNMRFVALEDFQDDMDPLEVPGWSRSIGDETCSLRKV